MSAICQTRGGAEPIHDQYASQDVEWAKQSCYHNLRLSKLSRQPCFSLTRSQAYYFLIINGCSAIFLLHLSCDMQLSTGWAPSDSEQCFALLSPGLHRDRHLVDSLAVRRDEQRLLPFINDESGLRSIRLADVANQRVVDRDLA